MAGLSVWRRKQEMQSGWIAQSTQWLQQADLQDTDAEHSSPCDSNMHWSAN